MTLRQKTLLIIGTTLVCLLLVLSLVLFNVWSIQFSRIETQQTQQNVERVMAAIEGELTNLKSTLNDWAPWDETYNFVRDRNSAYIQGNLNNAVIANLKLNVVVYVDQAGNVVFGEGFDLQQGKAIPLPKGLKQDFITFPQLIHHTNSNSSIAGVLSLPQAPLLIASQPILKSDRSGPSAGTLIFGRFLDAAEIQKLGKLTHLSISAYSLQDPLPEDVLAARNAFENSSSIYVKPLSRDRVAGYAQILDIYAKPALILRLDSARDVYLEGQKSCLYLIQAILLVGLVFGAITLLLLEKLVLSRLARLGKQVRYIHSTGDLSARLHSQGRDELSRLADMLNQLLTALEQSQQQLTQAKSGLEQRVKQRTAALTRANEQLIAEMDERHRVELQLRSSESHLRTHAQQLEQALKQLQDAQIQLIHSEKMSSLGQLVAGVAHEINNPITFVYGNLSYACEYTKDLLSLLALYQKHISNPPEAVKALTATVDFDFLATDFPKLLNSMQVGVERIRGIVLSLRNFSRLDEAERKTVDLHEGLESTLLILQHRLQLHNTSNGKEIEVVRDYGDLPKVECYAGQINQVFMNLLSNAIDAVAAQPVTWNQALPMDKQSGSPRNELEMSARVKGYSTAVETGSETKSNRWIRICTRWRTGDRTIEVRISDSGPGIPNEILPKIFEPFFTTKPIGKGTGLGLSISYQIVVERHSGRLRCISPPGRGAEFIVEIPQK